MSPLAVGDLGTRLETRLDFRHLLGLPREIREQETVRERSAGSFPEQRLVIESSMKLNSDFSLHSSLPVRVSYKVILHLNKSEGILLVGKWRQEREQGNKQGEGEGAS